MKGLGRLLWGDESRSISASTFELDPVSQDGMYGWSSTTRALRLAYSYACVRIISDALAAAPLKVYRENSKGKTPLDVPPVFSDPYPMWGLSEFDWKYQATSSLVMRGNTFGLERGTDPLTGLPTMVRWLSPDCVTVQIDPETDRMHYLVDGVEVLGSRVFHARGFLLPGVAVGLSPVDQFRHVIDLGLNAEEFTAQWFKDGSHPTSVLSSKNPLTEPQANTAKQRWREATNGNRGVVALGGDWSWQRVQDSPKESASTEVLQQCGREAAIIWGVPPWMLGVDTGSSLTYSTVESQWQSFQLGTARQYAIRLEQMYERMLPRGQHVRHNLDADLRADTLNRYQAYAISLTNGFRTIPEIRDLEDLPPIPPGEATGPPPPPAPPLPPAAP